MLTKAERLRRFRKRLGPRRIRVIRQALKDYVDATEVIPAFPNSFPYNELLLSNKLSAKTRTWRWKHRGLTLLYTSTSTDRPVADIHELNPKEAKRMVLVGVGELQPVRVLTQKERRQIQREFRNNRRNTGIYLNPENIFRYEFKNLKRFKTPIEFRPPKGQIMTFKVPVRVVAKALKEVGINPKKIQLN